MQPERLRSSSVIAACVATVVVVAYVWFLSLRERAPPEALFRLHNFLMTLLFAWWLVSDNSARQRFSPSFDHGWFAWAALPVYGLYHLVSTRRWRGLMIFAGMLVLLMLPAIAEMLTYNGS